MCRAQIFKDSGIKNARTEPKTTRSAATNVCKISERGPDEPESCMCADAVAHEMKSAMDVHKNPSNTLGITIINCKPPLIYNN